MKFILIFTKYFLSFLLFLIINFDVRAQSWINKFNVGIEGGIKWSPLFVNDSENLKFWNLSSESKQPGYSIGINFEYQLLQNLFIEVGAFKDKYVNKYYYSIVFSDNPKYYGNNINFDVFKLPLRFKGKINLFKQRVFLVQGVGISNLAALFGAKSINYRTDGVIVTQHESSKRDLSISTQDIIYYETQSSFIKNPSFEISLGLEIRSTKHWALTVLGQFQTSFSQNYTAVNSYQTNDNINSTYGKNYYTYLSSNGESYNLLVGVKYYFEEIKK
jgi:hypothetical protein